MLSSIQLATDVVAASLYIQKRHREAQSLSNELQEANWKLGYTTALRTPQGIVVDGVVCSGITCLLAFILAKYW